MERTMKLSVALWGLLAIFGGALPAHAGMLASYSFSGGAAATTSDPNLVAGAFQDGDGLADFAPSIGNAAPSLFKSYSSLPDGSFSSSGWVGFTVAPVPGVTVNFTSLQFDAQRDPTVPGSSGQLNIQIRSSTDGFATSSTLDTFAITANSGNFSVNLTQVLSQLVSLSSYSLRFYVHDAGSTSTETGFHLDNVELFGDVITGNINPTPEPTSMVLLGMGGGLVLVGRRFRRRPTAELPA
jgi:hypothetical protein